jgi:glycosyltransferase involved in cell wall biosynthesis
VKGQLAVLHVDGNRGWGGGQNQIVLLMRRLADNGIRQLCVCPHRSPLATRLQEMELPVETVGWVSSIDPRVFIAITRLAAAFDIIHCHDAHALQLALLPAKLRRVPLVASRRVRFKTNATVWNRADRVIAIADSVKEKLLASGVDNERIRVIHSGIDIGETRAVPAIEPPLRERFGIPAGAFVVGNAASFFPVKGQVVIPEAAAMLPNVHWLIAGEGPERGAIEAAIERYAVRDRVHLTGWLTDARALLKELDVYVLPSTDEALSNSILEAMAMRVPVLAADAGGPADLLRPVHALTGGVLFEPRNAPALAALVTRMRDEDLRYRVLAAQDERIIDYTIDKTAQGTLAVYHELLAR